MGHAVGGEQGAQAPGGDANVPAGQVDAVKAQEAAPAGLYEPAAHCTQTEAPAAAAYQPASQGRGYTDAGGQEAPAGQGAGVLRAPAAQKEPVGQAARREDAQQKPSATGQEVGMVAPFAKEAAQEERSGFAERSTG